MNTIVTTTCGQLRGADGGGVAVFKGIPYAAPPVGALRFSPPQPVTPWRGVRDALAYGASCPQPAARPTGWTAETAADEDCLYLNVWTPDADGDARRPVLVWIHGGGYAIGSGSWPLYDGARLARRGDAVVITVNHRLGPLGYLHLADLMGDGVATSGNNGNLDLVAALEWVRDNAPAFGGDPGNVTIFGESGGGAKVSNLLAMPAAEGLFHRAAIQSGPGLTAAKPDRATAAARGLLDALGLAADDLAGLRALPAEQLVAATRAERRMGFSPVVDGSVLPTHPVKALLAGTAADVPVIIGCNRDEFGTFAEIDEATLRERAQRLAGEAVDEALAVYRRLHPEAAPGQVATWMATDATMRAGSQALAKAKLDGPGRAPVFMYFFTYEMGGRAAHGYEIAFVFDNIGRTHVSEAREKLAGEMSEAWLAFARTGDPSHDGLGLWPAYEPDSFATMVFQRGGSVVVDDPNGPARELWARLPRRPPAARAVVPLQSAAMPDVLALHTAADPEKVAVIDGDRVMNRREFNTLVNRYADVMLGAGVKAGEKVLWVGQNSLEVVAVNHAARKVGAVCVPMNYRLAPDEAQYVVDNCDAVIVLFDVEQVDQLASIRGNCERVRAWYCFRSGATPPAWAQDFDALADTASTDEPVPVGEDETAGTTMIYTSGTTGKPKGTVRRTQASKYTADFIALLGWGSDEVYISTGPLYHSAPLGFMLIVQQLGGSVVVQRHFDAEDWLRLIDQHKVTTSFSAPTPVRRAVDLPAEVRDKYDVSSLRILIANAAPWPFELKKKYVERINDYSLFEVYGSTELGVNTMLLPDEQMRKPGSCGRPIPGVEIKLFDDDGNEVTEPMQPGELYVLSDATFAMYYKDPEKYEKGKRGQFMSVGDIAYFDDEGFYYICDRKNDMIISGGVNIYPAEIEAVLVAHSDIADAAVFGIPDDEWGEAVHAVITTYDGGDVDQAALDAFCREHLAGYKVPRSHSLMKEIPRSASGKILKRELREPYWAGRASRVG